MYEVKYGVWVNLSSVHFMSVAEERTADGTQHYLLLYNADGKMAFNPWFSTRQDAIEAGKALALAASEEKQPPP